MRTPKRIAVRSFRPSLHVELTSHIRKMILHHELEPDEWVPESELCEKLGISRTPLREALKVLASEKLVEISPNRGGMVASLRPNDVDELFEAQAIIEGSAASLACKRATDEDVEAFRKIHLKMLRCFERRDRTQYFSLNQDLHLSLVAMSHNSALVSAHSTLFIQVERARFLALDVGQRWADSVEQHEAILSAVASRDAELAKKLVEHHILETREAVKSAVELQNNKSQKRGRTRPRQSSAPKLSKR